MVDYQYLLNTTIFGMKIGNWGYRKVAAGEELKSYFTIKKINESFLRNFLVCFVPATDAQSDYFGSTAKESLFCWSDSTIGAFEDSVAITEKILLSPLPDPDIVSKATWTLKFYSRNLEGTKTATGENILSWFTFTAASNNYKLNAWVFITNQGARLNGNRCNCIRD